MTLPAVWQRSICCAILLLSGPNFLASSPTAAVLAFIPAAGPPRASKLNIAPSGRGQKSIASSSTTPASTTSLPAVGTAVEAAAAVGVPEWSAGTFLNGAVGGGATDLLPPWTVLLSDGIMDDPSKLPLFALAGLGVAAAGFKTAVYWRMQYVVRKRVALRFEFL